MTTLKTVLNEAPATSTPYYPTTNTPKSTVQQAIDHLATELAVLAARFVAVQDFGAVGDGSTSDQTAFNAAIASSNANIYVPNTGSAYILTSLSNVNLDRFYGPGWLSIAGVITPVPAIAQRTSADLPQLYIQDRDWQPSQTGALVGSTRKGPILVDVIRTGGFGSYGAVQITGAITASTVSSEFDVGITSWMTNRNLGGGQVFGAWFGSNTPSSSLSQTYTSGAATGVEINVGNRWADFGLLTDTGNTRETVGLKLVPDVLPASDGSTASIYPGSFAMTIGRSVNAHTWWTGILTRQNAINPGGYARRTNGGSSDANKPLAAEIFGGHWAETFDFGTSTIGTVFDLAAATVGTRVFNLSAAQKLLVKADLDLEPGIDVQAYDADLASWAGVTRAAGFDTFVATPTSANLNTLVTDQTGSGALVFATTPTLVTPLLGTPTSGTLTNCTGYPFTSLSGTLTSTQLAAYISDETGSGAAVFGTSPSLTTSALLSDGFVFNWNAGDVTLTHSTNLLTGEGGQLLWTYNGAAATAPIRVVNTTDAASNTALTIASDRATPATLDQVNLDFEVSNASGTQFTAGRLLLQLTDATAGSVDSQWGISVTVANSLTRVLNVAAGSIFPNSNNATALGLSGTNEWSDLWLGNGAVIGFNSTDIILTHSSNLLTGSGGSFAFGGGAIATSATDGFLYVPTCAGTPTGVPTTVTGYAAIVVNTTANKLYFYSGGAWRDAGP
jgi:hypothetical protein